MICPRCGSWFSLDSATSKVLHYRVTNKVVHIDLKPPDQLYGAGGQIKSTIDTISTIDKIQTVREPE